VASKTSPFEAHRRTHPNTAPLYIGVAVLLAGSAGFYYLNYTKPAAPAETALTPEGKAYARNLRLSGIELKATSAYFGQKIVEIEGKIGNSGDKPLRGVEIYCVFYDTYGQLVLRKRVPIVSPKMGGLQPSETKSFRLPFDELPDSWNQAMPQLVIASVTFP
jgi:hypothetical protein